MKKVLFLITKSNWGGAQRYVYDLATNLPTGEFETVVALGGNGPLGAKLQAAHCRVVPIPSLTRDISPTKEWSAFRDIQEVGRSERPDILHVNSSKAGILGALAGRLVGVPLIIFTAHGWAFNEDRPVWQKLSLKILHWLTVLLSHRTIAVSNQVKMQMNWPFVQHKIIVIHNGRAIDNLFSYDEGRTFIINKEPRLREFQSDFWTMTIAELHPVKRHEAMIEVMKKMADSDVNVRHLIIGDGETQEMLRTQIDALGLQEHVFLLGRIDEASRYLRAADLFVLASRSEGLPYVLIEALQAGVPIVATKVGGIPEVVEDGVSGILTEPLDNKALFEAILSLIRDGDTRRRLAAGTVSEAKRFSLEKTLERTSSLYGT